MTHHLSRRRFIQISAAVAGLSIAPLGTPRAKADTSLVEWRGTLLGAVATIKLHHHDPHEAERLIALSITEARRLERLFSLYLTDSALVALNRTGVLLDPAPELVDILARSKRYAELTDGRFDPTVQPLWTLYADHFARPDADPNGPPQPAVADALTRVGYDKLSISHDRLVMPRGTTLTLNGIAQGYVTDTIVELLRSQGVQQSLVDMGEARAIGPRPDGLPWEVAIEDPEHTGRTAAMLPIVDRAVSTSGAYGFRFDPQGRFNHLFDPHSGDCAQRYRSVTTVADNATAADALSTAFSLMSPPEIRAVLPRSGIERVHLIDATGAAIDLGA
ncbi:Nitrous oxide reductase accessory protein NosX (required for nitrous oxide reduction), ApbE-like lipoprotein [Bradyrhizobium sp. ORS 285]|uniref:FAD:protein FMN transferase n=1 Tax=Bradyrhizobium sp. ORS 285 TaxID=115808 RepID=UPI000240840E|nr:FAD:protein FMN transferase [Bradyrhizobium sp. ORS 285]CCD86226.1 Nitrous oxide reductase accessory protein NosX (required for nitrous oxide reduction), ApbE-like lipoprotein [Bradyrhizobium sp. ORS 285]SMX61007.1 Nitrous oxide reductase accessory protein NosX (required for nitrous oxide reduction), ApbE-like lipoprotein [Bradyrhizobium sp. ORS 285]